MEEISAANQLEKRYRTTAVIYLAQIFSVIILVIVGYLLAKNSAGKSDASSTTALWVAILFIAVGTFLLRRRLYQWERLKNITLTKGVSGLFAALQTNSIILAATAEAIAIIGLVIALLSGVGFDILRAGLVALIVLLINFPRQSVWRKIVEGLEKV